MDETSPLPEAIPVRLPESTTSLSSTQSNDSTTSAAAATTFPSIQMQNSILLLGHQQSQSQVNPLPSLQPLGPSLNTIGSASDAQSAAKLQLALKVYSQLISMATTAPTQASHLDQFLRSLVPPQPLPTQINVASMTNLASMMTMLGHLQQPQPPRVVAPAMPQAASNQAPLPTPQNDVTARILAQLGLVSPQQQAAQLPFQFASVADNLRFPTRHDIHSAVQEVALRSSVSNHAGQQQARPTNVDDDRKQPAQVNPSQRPLTAQAATRRQMAPTGSCESATVQALRRALLAKHAPKRCPSESVSPKGSP